MDNYYYDGQWGFLRFGELGEDNFNRLCLRLLRVEISPDIQPSNKKGRDNKCDAFLQPGENKYGLDGLWWFQFKFRDHARNDNNKLKSKFKSEIIQELDEVVKKKNLPKNYIAITPIELTGKDWTDWFQDNIINKYSSKIPNIRIWDFSKLNSLLDQYSEVKSDFQRIVGRQGVSQTSVVPKQASHILLDDSKPFFEKLSYLLKLINKKDKIDSKEEKVVLCILQEDTKLAWHFLKNLDKPEWFLKIKDNIIKSVVELEEDSAVKFQLLSYFERCADKYSDEIIPLIVQLENNTQDYNILSSLVKTLGKLKPKQQKNIKLLWEIFSKLTGHQHPWVRRELPKSLLSFVNYDVDKVLEILEKVFFYNPPPQDVTQGSPTLALTFQGRDNENWVFEEAMKALSTLMNNHKYAKKAFDLTIKVEVETIKSEGKDHDVERGITLDYSYIWLGEKSFEKLEYNHNKKERVALEIEKALDGFAQSKKKLTSDLFDKLLAKKHEVFYLAVVKTLTKYTSEFQADSKRLVFDIKLWGVYNIRNYYLQTLVTKFFKTDKESKLKKFVELVDSYKEKDKKRTLYAKQNLLVAIPEKLRTAEAKKQLKAVSEALKTKPGVVRPAMVMTSWSGPRPDITVKELQKKNDDELVQIMIDSSTGKRASSYDVAPSFAGLVSQNPDKLKDLLPQMKNKKLEPDFAGEMVSAYIKKSPTNISDIVDLIPMLSAGDTWARIELARYFNDICRKSEIQKYEQKLLKKIKGALFTLSKDPNPKSDETIKSNNPRPDDAITRGINSVRGITVQALIAFSHYFPKDKEVIKKIKELAEDKTNAVKATLIYYLRYLIGKNYSLCEEVINKFRNRRDPEIDFALIHFFAQLDCQKFIGKQDFIKSLFNNTNEQINEDLGELIGARYISSCDVRGLVDEVIGNRKGTKNTVRSLAFVFESQLASLIGKDNKDIKVARYLKKLLGPQSDFEVVERASFVFERDEIEPEHFEFLDKNGLMDELVKNQRNIPAQSHLVNYLYKCVDANVSVERCLQILHEQVINIGVILSDQLIAKKISEIINKLIKADLSKTAKGHLLDIFNEGLERGWDEFYSIYYSHQKALC